MNERCPEGAGPAFAILDPEPIRLWAYPWRLARTWSLHERDQCCELIAAAFRHVTRWG